MIVKNYFVVSLVFMLSLGIPFRGFAEEASREELLKRTEALEKEVNELKAIIKSMQSKQDVVTKRVESIAESSKHISRQLEESKQAAKLVEKSEEQIVISKHKTKIYGFLKLDSSFDDSKTNNPDAPRYAISEGSTEDESQYAMTAMNSRLGLKYYGPEVTNAKVFGNVELDFYDTSSDNSQKPRRRLNYNILVGVF